VLTRPARPADLTVRYGPGSEHVADAWLPQGTGPHPLVIVVHGGSWQAKYDRAHTGPMCEALADAGYLACAVEYHRVGHELGGWPGTFADVAAVVDAVPTLLGEQVAADRIALLGHSAGGHLALWAAARHRLPADHPWHRAEPLVRGVVSLAGSSNLGLAHEIDMDDGSVASFLGGGPDAYPDRYAVADPIRLVPTGVRTVLLHGDADDIVPIEISRSYATAARAAGDDVELRELPGIGHFAVIDPLSTVWPTVLDALAEILGTGPKRS